MPIATALKDKRAVILPNHGAITTGDNIQVAFVRMILLEGMAERNIAVAEAAQALGLKPVPITTAAARRAKAEIARIPVFAPLWKDFLTRLSQTDPDLFEGRQAAQAG
jgi:ribulose-5-phosphate 4-epimerase/fuculose-1-phosphate aldolase